MLRIIFGSVLVIHGLLHLIGVAKAWDIGPQRELTDSTPIYFSESSFKVAGASWLLASILFLSGAVAFLLRKEWYWIPAAAALLISQTLIIIYWQDAKYGSIVNVIILIAVVVSAAAMTFNRTVRQEVDLIRNQAIPNQRIVSEEMIAGLPGNVQRWMRSSNVVGRKVSNVIRIAQRGSLRTKPESKWMPFQAVQHFTIDPPAFVWSARIEAAPFFTIAGRDKYHNGKGNMVIKPLYLFTAANGTGNEINQGTLLRYLAEMAWFPQAAVSKYLQWEFIDDQHAKVTMDYGGTSASGVYSFNEDGSVARFEALRYGDFEGTYRKEKWSIAVKGYKAFHGIHIGHKNEVTWKLKEGDFKWLRLEVIAVD